MDAIWVSDRTVAAMHPKLSHAVLGSHPGLAFGVERKTPVYDYAHMSYAWGRREDLYRRMRELHLREAPNAFGEARAHILAETTLMVTAHQYPAPVSEPLRIAIAAASHMPVLSETLADPYPHNQTDLVLASYNEMPAYVEGLVHKPERLKELSEALHQRLCVEWPFRRGVEEAVARCLS
jgi:hypothetical protein